MPRLERVAGPGPAPAERIRSASMSTELPGSVEGVRGRSVKFGTLSRTAP
ncbi:hypothetical protein ACFV4Q_11545 [Streptomyces nojiriensis]